MHRSLNSGRRNIERGERPATTPRRSGKILVMFAVLLPALLGMTGLIIDGSLMMAEYRGTQHVADAAATAAARTLQLGDGAAAARERAIEVVQNGNGLGDAVVTV